MSETKFTSGEWNVGGDGDSVWVEPADKNANVICDLIGRLYDSDSGKTQLTEEDIANAHLIAASPDLLEACETALNIRHWVANERARQSVGQTTEALKWAEKISQAEERIRAAITKATNPTSGEEGKSHV
jgi:hypothetical protein